MLNRKQHKCKNCKDRCISPNCHNHCGEYLDYKKKWSDMKIGLSNYKKYGSYNLSK